MTRNEALNNPIICSIAKLFGEIENCQHRYPLADEVGIARCRKILDFYKKKYPEKYPEYSRTVWAMFEGKI